MKSFGKALSSVGVVLALTSMVACADDDTDSSGDEQNVTARIGEEGGTCGGIAAIRCKSGLECKITASHPDAAGKCVKKPAPGEEGGMCGGIAGLGCKAGLECKLEGEGFDRSGTCVKKAAPRPGEEGGTCGGIAGLGCKAGLECKVEGDHPDASGRCVKK